VEAGIVIGHLSLVICSAAEVTTKNGAVETKDKGQMTNKE
jgi:hypothetical protein